MGDDLARRAQLRIHAASNALRPEFVLQAAAVKLLRVKGDPTLAHRLGLEVDEQGVWLRVSETVARAGLDPHLPALLLHVVHHLLRGHPAARLDTATVGEAHAVMEEEANRGCPVTPHPALGKGGDFAGCHLPAPFTDGVSELPPTVDDHRWGAPPEYLSPRLEHVVRGFVSKAAWSIPERDWGAVQGDLRGLVVEACKAAPVLLPRHPVPVVEFLCATIGHGPLKDRLAQAKSEGVGWLDGHGQSLFDELLARCEDAAVRRALAGDDTFTAAVFRRWGPRVEGTAPRPGLVGGVIRQFGLAHVSAEVEQAVWARALWTYRPDKGFFRNWLVFVARTYCQNEAEKHRRRDEGIEEIDAWTVTAAGSSFYWEPGRRTDLDEWYDRLRQRIAELPPAQRAVKEVDLEFGFLGSSEEALALAREEAERSAGRRTVSPTSDAVKAAMVGQAPGTLAVNRHRGTQAMRLDKTEKALERDLPAPATDPADAELGRTQDLAGEERR